MSRGPALLSAALLGGLITACLFLLLAPDPRVIVVERDGYGQISANKRSGLPNTDGASTSPADPAVTPAKGDSPKTSSLILSKMKEANGEAASSSIEEAPGKPESIEIHGNTLQVISLQRPPPIAERTVGPPVSKHKQATTETGALDDALSFALEAAQPFLKQGFSIRQDFIGGHLLPGETRTVPYQLFKGNEYWFWMGTDERDGEIAVHVYNAAGMLADAENWRKPHMAAARVTPEATGTYYLRPSLEKNTGGAGRNSGVNWAIAYGFK